MTPPSAQRCAHNANKEKTRTRTRRTWIQRTLSRAISHAGYCTLPLFFLVAVASLPLASGQEASDEGDAEPSDTARRIKESSSAWLVGLNKRSGQAKKLRAPVGRNLRFETLTIRLVSCARILYPRFEDSAALLSISERKEGTLFKGWMYAQYPSLSTMDHPIYDVWVERCLP